MKQVSYYMALLPDLIPLFCCYFGFQMRCIPILQRIPDVVYCQNLPGQESQSFLVQKQKSKVPLFDTTKPSDYSLWMLIKVQINTSHCDNIIAISAISDDHFFSHYNDGGHGKRRATVASMVASTTIQGQGSIQWWLKAKCCTYPYSLWGIEPKWWDWLGKVSFWQQEHPIFLCGLLVPFYITHRHEKSSQWW
jgi:hypothetical protein